MFARGQSADAREGVMSFLESASRFPDRVSGGLPELFRAGRHRSSMGRHQAEVSDEAESMASRTDDRCPNLISNQRPPASASRAWAI